MLCDGVLDNFGSVIGRAVVENNNLEGRISLGKNAVNRLGDEILMVVA